MLFVCFKELCGSPCTRFCLNHAGFRGNCSRVKSITDLLMGSTRPLVIGHRGYCSRAPENTLPSFQLAIEAGVDLVELDYQQSRDGVPIVIHDPTLDRTTDARKKWKQRRIKVSEKTAAEIQTLDAGSWFSAKFAGTKVPLLTEAIDFICCNGAVPLIEHKSGDAATLVHLLRSRNLINRVVVISFNWKFLREFHELEPAQALGALGPPARLSNGRKPVHSRRGLGPRLSDLMKTGARIAVWNPKASRRGIRAARQCDLKVWVYTVNEPRLAQRLAKLGARGIITNEIERIHVAISKS